jgi:hypothetical protein
MVISFVILLLGGVAAIIIMRLLFHFWGSLSEKLRMTRS